MRPKSITSASCVPVTAAPISSLKYGKCQLPTPGSTTPSSAEKRLAVIVAMGCSSPIVGAVGCCVVRRRRRRELIAPGLGDDGRGVGVAAADRHGDALGRPRPIGATADRGVGGGTTRFADQAQVLPD